MRDQQARCYPGCRIEVSRPIWQMVGVAAMLILAGCNGHDPLSWPRAGATRQAATARPLPTAKPAPPHTDPTEPPPSAEIARSEGDIGPDRLIGLDEERLTSMFGPPTQKIDRAPGKAWLYRRGRCALDVSLYPDIQTRVFRTLAYEVTSDDNTDKGKRLCLAELRSAAGAR